MNHIESMAYGVIGLVIILPVILVLAIIGRWIIDRWMGHGD